MQYSFDESLREIRRRGEVLRSRRSRTQVRALSAAVAILFLSLLSAGTGLVSGHASVLEETAYGAFLLPGDAGGYILAGVTAFVVGVLVTLLCIRCRARQSGGPGENTGESMAPEQRADESLMQNAEMNGEKNCEYKANAEGETR